MDADVRNVLVSREEVRDSSGRRKEAALPWRRRLKTCAAAPGGGDEGSCWLQAAAVYSFLGPYINSGDEGSCWLQQHCSSGDFRVLLLANSWQTLLGEFGAAAAGEILIVACHRSRRSCCCWRLTGATCWWLLLARHRSS